MSTAKSTNGSTPPAPPGPRPRRPTTLARTKNVLGAVVVQLQTGELEPKRANALVYALSTLAQVIAGSEVERRLAEVERFTTKAPAWRPTGPLLSHPSPPVLVKGPETEQ